MTRLSLILAVAEEAEEVSDPTAGLGIGAIALILAVSGVLIWTGYLVLNTRRRRRQEETPANLQQYLSDDELENKRLTRVLGWAVIVAAVLAISLPVYYVNESKRQADAAEAFHELDVEEGEHWYVFFECEECHGPEGVGGSTEFIEPRSDIEVPWAVPSLNDIFYRFSQDEAEFVEVFGRQGTPMPGNGLEGGGSMTIQEVDQVMEYLRSIQIPQEEVLARADPAVDRALARIVNGATAVEGLLVEQGAELADINEAGGVFAAIATMPTEVRALMSGDGTCTTATAALIDLPCSNPGTDTDRDGVSDVVEIELSGPAYAATVDTQVLVRVVTSETNDDGETTFIVTQQQDPDRPELYGLELDPDNRFTQTDVAGQPILDLGRLDSWLTALDAAHLTYSVLTDRNEVFADNTEARIEFLETSQGLELWIPNGVELTAEGLDLSELTVAMNAVIEAAIEDDQLPEGTEPFTLTEEDAARGVGLFNSYCARCHTGGYNSGAPFEVAAGSILPE